MGRRIDSARRWIAVLLGFTAALGALAVLWVAGKIHPEGSMSMREHDYDIELPTDRPEEDDGSD